MGDADATEQFTAMFDEHSTRVYAYARRHCDPNVAQDVVADTFLVAWRRWEDVPAEPLPWLLVVARNTLANHRRGLLRQHRLAGSMAHVAELAGPAAGVDQAVVERDLLLRGLAQLTDAEREALLLVAWDGLRSMDAARVAGCSPRAFEVRLSRARARLIRVLNGSTRKAPAARQSDHPQGAASGAFREAR